MGKSIWDTRFGKRGIAEDERVQVEEGDSWKTIHGAHVLLGDDGRIKAGAEGKFNGARMEAFGRPSKERRKELDEIIAKQWVGAKRDTSRALQNDPSLANMSQNEVRQIAREAGAKVVMDYLNQYEIPNPPKQLTESMSEIDAIKQIAGGDETGGSCASATMAFIANQELGLDVHDFRGGVSQIAGSLLVFDAMEEIRDSGFSPDGYNPNKEGGGTFQYGRNEDLVKNTMRCLDSMKPGENYVALIGGHMTMVRRLEDSSVDGTGEIQYLELQSENPKENGWKTLVDEQWLYGGSGISKAEEKEARTRALEEELRGRFGVRDDREQCGAMQGVVPVSRFVQTDCMKNMLQYINTSENKQMKGSSGSIK